MTRKFDPLAIENIATPVDPDIAIRAFLGAEDERVNAVVDKLRAVYVESDRDDKIAKQLLRLLRRSQKKRYHNRPEGDDNRKAGGGFLVIGGSGSGKTAALERILANHPAFPGYGIVGSGCPFVTVLCPSPSTMATLGNAVLIALGYPPDKPLPEAQAWVAVRKILKKRRILFLHFDEIDVVLQQKNANPKELKKIQDTLRGLMNSPDWPVQLVLSGIEETRDLFENDRQLQRRLKFVVFDGLTVEHDAEWIRNAVQDFVKAAGLTFVERPGATLIERLIHASAYQFGLVFELLIEGIEEALLAKKKTFGIDDLIESYADRTSQPEELNIFASAAWQTINPAIVFEKNARKPTKKTEVKRFDG